MQDVSAQGGRPLGRMFHACGARGRRYKLAKRLFDSIGCIANDHRFPGPAPKGRGRVIRWENRKTKG